jgi:AbrB family looped-hinge helix DNA binding protein
MNERQPGADMSRATLRSRGQLTLPPDVRQVLHVKDGDEIEFTVEADGTVVLRGLTMIPADQAWFWSATWQEGEREASEDIAAGRGELSESSDAFLKSLS